MTLLFTNTVHSNSSLTKTRDFLGDPENLPRWNSAVQSVTAENDNQFVLYRETGAIIPQERLHIITAESLIIFQSTGGKFDYDLVFELTPSPDFGLTIKESCYLTSRSFSLVTKIITPIIKKAFNDNLTTLKQILDAS